MPARVRTVTGLVGAIAMLLSSLPHSLMGWPAQREALARAQVPADTVIAVCIGWHFGGVAIAAFGLIAAISFAQVLRGHPPHMRATTIVGLAYAGFGFWALFVTRDAFPLVFIVPGLMVLTGSTAHR